MSYTKTIWENDPSTSSPITAAALNNIEDGVSNLDSGISAIESNLLTSWIPISETFTYASASTIAVPSGAISRYQIGDKLKWTQSTVHYGVIVDVTDTLLTIAINTDYVVENSAISAIYYSRAENPFGFPDCFEYTPVITAETGIYTTITASACYAIRGRIVTISGSIIVTTKNTAAGALIFSVPKASSVEAVGSCFESAITGEFGGAYIAASASTVSLHKYDFSTLWANGNNVKFSVSYFI